MWIQIRYKADRDILQQRWQNIDTGFPEIWEMPIPGNILSSEQPVPIEDVDDHCRGVGQGDLEKFLSTQTIL